MKDLHDVQSYLVNILGAGHELVNAVEQAIQTPQQTSLKELVQSEKSDADEIILWALSGMIFMIKPIGHIEWHDEKIRSQLKDTIFNWFGLDQCFYELEMDEKYPDESDELMALGIEIENIIDNEPERITELRKIIERDCAGDVLEYLSTKDD